MAQQKSSNKLQKSANNLDTEDLLAALEQEEIIAAVPVKYDEDDILNFIATFQLEPGTELIKTHTLYLIYKVWSKNPVTKSGLSQKLTKYFELEYKSGTTYFKLNKSAIKITHEAYNVFNKKAMSRKVNNNYAKRFENFLKFHSIERGTYWVNFNVLEFIYEKYCAATGIKGNAALTMGKNTFIHYCRIYLEEKQTKHGYMYAVSDNVKEFLTISEIKKLTSPTPYKRKRKSKRA